jgi:Mce-associated membrane protein
MLGPPARASEPVVYKDRVTLSMRLVDGTWLVDDMVTSPVQD